MSPTVKKVVKHEENKSVGKYGSSNASNSTELEVGSTQLAITYAVLSHELLDIN